MWGSIPGPRDHDLSRKQTLNGLNHPGAPMQSNFKLNSILLFKLLGSNVYTPGKISFLKKTIICFVSNQVCYSTRSYLVFHLHYYSLLNSGSNFFFYSTGFLFLIMICEKIRKEEKNLKPREKRSYNSHIAT